MGAGVGLTMGFLFGTFSILRYVSRNDIRNHILV